MKYPYNAPVIKRYTSGFKFLFAWHMATFAVLDNQGDKFEMKIECYV
jgi:hypothetical protein